MSTLSTDPPRFEMGSTETLPLKFDFTNYLAVGESVTSPSASLIDLSTGSAYATGLSGSPTVSGNTVTQIITSLQARRKYSLRITATLNSNKVETMELLIDCIF